jgi:serine/threonine protein phosphatase 1
MKYYAIADLHGRYDLLDKCLSIIGNINDKERKIITLGDYVDRGPESKQIIDRLMKEQADQPETFICLQGNHEAMMVESIVQKLDPEWWIGNGGGSTLLSYGHPDVRFLSEVKYSYVPEDHIKWLASLPHFYETEKQVFVHAGVPADDLDLIDQDKEQMEWMLYGKNDTGGYRGKHVVHGHHQFADGPHQWFGKRGGRTDLDTWAYHTGRIVIGVFDDTQLHALEFIEVSV